MYKIFCTSNDFKWLQEVELKILLCTFYKSFSFFLLFLLIFPCPSSSTEYTFWISNSGNDTLTCGSFTEPCKTFEFVQTGTCRLLKPPYILPSKISINFFEGIYTGLLNTEIRFEGLRYADLPLLNIVGVYNESNWENATETSTIIDCENVYHGLIIDHWSPLNLIGITFRNCVDQYSLGAVNITDVNSLVIDHCIFSSNNGSGLRLGFENSFDNGFISGVVKNSKFLNNRSLRGGGMQIFSMGSLLIQNCFFIGNSALFFGGGMIITNGNIMVKESFFSKNYARYMGGGIHVDYNFNSFLTSSVINCSFIQNNASIAGGGVSYFYGLNYLSNSLLKENYGNNGGAIFAQIYSFEGYISVVSDCIIRNNSAIQGGGIFVNGAPQNPTPFNVINSKVELNIAQINGGGVHCENTISDWSGTEFSKNQVLGSSQYDQVYCDKGCSNAFCSPCKCSSCADCGMNSSCALSNNDECTCFSAPFCERNSICEMEGTHKICNCDSGWIGNDCSINLMNLLVIIGVSVSGLLTIIIIVILVIKIRKRKRSYQQIN